MSWLRSLAAIFTVFVLNILLAWIPFIGGLVAGFVGGYLARGGPWRGFVVGLVGGMLGFIVVALLVIASSTIPVVLGVCWFCPMVASLAASIVILVGLLLSLPTALGGAIGGYIVSRKR